MLSNLLTSFCPLLNTRHKSLIFIFLVRYIQHKITLINLHDMIFFIQPLCLTDVSKMFRNPQWLLSIGEVSLMRDLWFQERCLNARSENQGNSEWKRLIVCKTLWFFESRLPYHNIIQLPIYHLFYLLALFHPSFWLEYVSAVLCCENKHNIWCGLFSTLPNIHTHHNNVIIGI